MQVYHLIIHEIEKEPDSPDAHLFLSQSLSPVDDRAEWLCARLNQVFEQKNDLLQGYLSPPEDALFPGYLQHLMDEGLLADAFSAFSRDTMQALQLSLQGVTGAKGGYLVYTHYEHNQEQWLGIFLVRNTEGLVFSKDESRHALSLNAVTYLQVDKLALACRIRLGRYDEGVGACVEMMKYAKTQKEISDYFVNWIGLERPASSRELTQQFLEIVQALPAPIDEESGEKLAAEVFQERALNFAVSNPSRTVNLKAFEQAFYGEEPAVQNFIQDHDIQIEEEFRVDRSAVKQFYNYKLAHEGLFLHFTRTHLRHGQISLDGDTITIHSPELADQLRDILSDNA